MADSDHLKILEQGVETWNKWREGNPDIRPDLRRANLSEADLRRANLSKADLREANLSEADLRRADLSEADLSEANLSGARLIWAYLSWAKLIRTNLFRAGLNWANLYGADLSEADLIRADLHRAYLSRAKLGGANLCEANLSGARLIKESFDDGANLSGAIVDEITLRKTKNIQGGQIGVNGIWDEATDSAALMTLTPPGSSMEGPNPDAVIESLKRARRIHGFSLSLVGIVLLIAAISLPNISFPYAKDVSISPAQFGNIAMPMSIALLFLVNIFLADALKSARYLSDRASAMSVGNFPWVISKYSNRELRRGLWGKILFLFRWVQSFIPRFIMSFHGFVYIYYVKKWAIFSNQVFYTFSAILIIFSLWTFFLSQQFQKPILFDRKTEEERQTDLAKLTKAVELQTKSISELTDLFKQNQDNESPNSTPNNIHKK